jgi:hypothetical protein
MTRPLAFAALALLAVTSCASTLTVRATMPTMGDAGVCGAPVVRDTLRGTIWLHVRYAGPRGARPEVVRHDSLLTSPGAVALWQRTDLDAGVYAMSVWPSNRAGAGCDSAYADTASTRPGKVVVMP